MLPALGADSNSWTVSGYSGGAFTADHFTMINSAKIKGMASFCGGPFGQMFHMDNMDNLKTLNATYEASA
jgi:hypothetical protein